MTGMMHIRKVLLPSSHVLKVYEHLRDRGEHRVEGVALWAGQAEGKTFHVLSTVIPAQTGYRTEDGLLYSVAGEELERINRLLYERRETLFLQVHSHPGEAYHSDTDDRYPIVTINGGLSIVVPDFGRGPFSVDSWAVYRLAPGGVWNELDKKSVYSIFKIV
ncbi:MAG TPA: Mov34/MPN/PAD-1 family protein [Puia sp.]|jgi:proteasome lid subunit RPN8/RPN11|nr:Mov34/MPN/PAD-1 family protein [Puia sp.]